MAVRRHSSWLGRGGSSQLLALVAMLVLAGGIWPLAPLYALTANPATVFINEIHYENVGTDTGEAIEIAGPAGTNLSGWKLVLYNGANGEVYASRDLGGVLVDEQNGYGTRAFTDPMFVLQNGAPGGDGIALVHETAVVQFLSYEGSFTATDGPAATMTSTNIGVAEGESTPEGASLQLVGTGATYQSFTWSATSTSTFNQINAGQAFQGPAIAINCPVALLTISGAATSGLVRGSDANGTIGDIAIVGGQTDGITLSGVTPATAEGGEASATLEVAATTAPGTYNVVIQFTNNDSPTPESATCSVAITVSAPLSECPAPPVGQVTPISTLQGSGAASPLAGETATITGTVTADFQASGGLGGFFVQDAGDGDPATSDGIFVFHNATDVGVGDPVQVTGVITEFNTLTEISSVASVTRCGTALAITPATVDLPLATVDGLEAYEGMLVTFPETLTVSQNFFQGRFGRLTLSADGRLYTPTNTLDPNEPDGSAVAAAANLNTRRTIILDDGQDRQNPDPIPYIGEDSTQRAGDTVTGLTGVIDFGPVTSLNTPPRSYRLQPTVAPIFSRANDRTAEPDPVGGNLRIASFNVLNYFTTLDQSGNTCYSSSGPTECRGANTPEEFTRQRTKIITALLAIDADVVGLIEIENNGVTAVGDLVGGLNAIAGSGTYTFTLDPTNDPITDTVRFGGDAIKVALIYKPGRVAPIGAASTSADPIFERPPLAQTFRHISSGQSFSVVVNHFKSKSGCPGDASDPNADKGDGQGCWNARRVEQAEALLAFVDGIVTTSRDPDVLVIGDLNAYGEEDPIDTLRGGGLIDQIAKRVPQERRYSYVFDGQAGYLDHALTTGGLDQQVSGVTEWHINADEPSVLDYNTEFKPQDLFSPTPYRSSDHDPVIVGLNMRTLIHLPLIGK